MWINSKVRSGQMPFTSFLIWLSAGDWLLPGGGRRGWELSEVSFWVRGSWSVTLSFRFLYENSSLVRLAVRWGRLQPWVPRGATQRPGYVNELKLVWFGDFKIQFWILCSGTQIACLAGGFSDTSMSRCGDRRTGRCRLLPVFRFSVW